MKIKSSSSKIIFIISPIIVIIAQIIWMSLTGIDVYFKFESIIPELFTLTFENIGNILFNFDGEKSIEQIFSIMVMFTHLTILLVTCLLILLFWFNQNKIKKQQMPRGKHTWKKGVCEIL